jgi:hypothetical protein
MKQVTYLSGGDDRRASSPLAEHVSFTFRRRGRFGRDVDRHPLARERMALAKSSSGREDLIESGVGRHQHHARYRGGHH